jgi:hypothetical protein
MWIAARRLVKVTTRMLREYRKASLQGLKPFSWSDLTAGLKPRPFRVDHLLWRLRNLFSAQYSVGCVVPRR